MLAEEGEETGAKRYVLGLNHFRHDFTHQVQKCLDLKLVNT
jgi:hypothetical protein